MNTNVPGRPAIGKSKLPPVQPGRAEPFRTYAVANPAVSLQSC